jgi:hypothetical protein
MNIAKSTLESPAAGITAVGKRVILSMGGKGGVGKTSVITGLAEWFQENDIPVKLLDLDTENKARGSLTHFFGGQVPKVNIHTPAGLDAFVDELTDGPPVILADMGAGAGQVTYEWFDEMFSHVNEAGIAFTSVGVITLIQPAWRAFLPGHLGWAIEPLTWSSRTQSLNTRTLGIGGRVNKRSGSSRPIRPPCFKWTIAFRSLKTPPGTTASR